MRGVSPSEYTHEAPTAGDAAGDLWHPSIVVGVPWRSEQATTDFEIIQAAEGNGWGGDMRGVGDEGISNPWRETWGGRTWGGERMPDMMVGRTPPTVMHPSSSSLANALVLVPQHTTARPRQTLGWVNAPTGSNVAGEPNYPHPYEAALHAPALAQDELGAGEPVLAHVQLGGQVALPEGLRPPRPTYQPMGHRLALAHNRAVSLMVSTSKLRKARADNVVLAGSEHTAAGGHDRTSGCSRTRGAIRSVAFRDGRSR